MVFAMTDRFDDKKYVYNSPIGEIEVWGLTPDDAVSTLRLHGFMHVNKSELRLVKVDSEHEEVR